MTTRTTIAKFWALAHDNKSAALDIHTTTGELALRCTRSAAGIEGNGTPPACMTDDWARILTSDKGAITHGSER